MSAAVPMECADAPMAIPRGTRFSLPTPIASRTAVPTEAPYTPVSQKQSTRKVEGIGGGGSSQQPPELQQLVVAHACLDLEKQTVYCLVLPTLALYPKTPRGVTKQGTLDAAEETKQSMLHTYAPKNTKLGPQIRGSRLSLVLNQKIGQMLYIEVVCFKQFFWVFLGRIIIGVFLFL